MTVPRPTKKYTSPERNDDLRVYQTMKITNRSDVGDFETFFFYNAAAQYSSFNGLRSISSRYY